MANTEKYILLQEEQFTPWLLPQKPWVTLILLAINILVFVAMCVSTGGQAVLSPTTQDLLNWGANYAPLTLTGEPWRLMTAAFLHIGIVHIAMNMTVLWYFGKICERLFGSFRYLAIYLLAAIGSSLFSTLYGMVITPIVAAGASGAICGILGAYFCFIRMHKRDFDEQIYAKMIKKFGEYAILIIVYGIFVHADHAAHFGGALVGALIAIALMPEADSKSSLQPPQLIGVAAVVLGMGALFGLEASGIVDVRGTVQLYQAEKIKEQDKEQRYLLNFIKSHPDNSGAYALLSFCDTRLNDNQAALDAAAAGLKLAPDNGADLYAHAFAAFRLGDYDTCIDDCSKIKSSDHYYGISRSFLLARVYGARGDLAEALSNAEDDTRFSDASKMFIYTLAGKDQTARDLDDAALKKNPKDPDALYVQIELNWHSGNYKDVMSAAQKLCDSMDDPFLRGYASFLYAAAAKFAGAPNPNSLMDKYKADLAKDGWLQNIGDYFEGRITAKQLIERAHHRDQQTEAHAYVGLNLLAEKHEAEAKPYLTWVVHNGISNYLEYYLARCELDRLEPSPAQKATSSK